MSDGARYYLALNRVEGLGPRRTRRLLARFGSAEGAWRASEPALAQVVGPVLARRLAEARATLDLDRELERLRRLGIDLVTWEDPAYPPLLREIPDPPPLLYVRGRLRPEDRRAVALVGTRRPSRYGRQVAERFAAGLARAGVTVVSGLALGIDGVAHRAALEAGGRTLAVLGCGLDRVYPSEHRALARRLVAEDRGALLSELPLGTPPRRGHFVARNRILSGLAPVTLVVEAGAHSGALITARAALEQGREVFAVPGSIFSPASAGTNRLLAEGAHPALEVEDLLVALGMELAGAREAAPASPPPPPPDLPPEAQALLRALSPDPQPLDEAAYAAGLDPATAARALTLLVLEGLVREEGGGRFARTAPG